MNPVEDARAALNAFAAGHPVIVLSEPGSGDAAVNIVTAAQTIEPATVAFMVRHGTGFIRAAISDAVAMRLDLPAMYTADIPHNEATDTVAVDARLEISTGISARDRAHTIRLLASPKSVPSDFTRPGHVVPVRVSRSVLDEPIAATAAVDLAQLADLEPVVALSALVGIDNPTQLMQRDEAVTFGREHSLALIAIDSIAAQVLMSRTSSGSGPVHLQQGDFTVLHYRDPRDGMTHYAFTRGDLAQRDELAVRIHPECIAGDVLGTQDCGCRQHLQSALDDASRNEVGIVLYLRGDDPHGSMTNSDQVSERNTRIATEMLKALRIADPGRTAVLC